MSQKELITLSQAAKMLGLTTAALRYRIAHRQLKAQKFGKTWILRMEDIETAKKKKGA